MGQDLGLRPLYPSLQKATDWLWDLQLEDIPTVWSIQENVSLTHSRSKERSRLLPCFLLIGEMAKVHPSFIHAFCYPQQAVKGTYYEAGRSLGAGMGPPARMGAPMGPSF